MVVEIKWLMEEILRVSTGNAVAAPPASVISRSTVEMVEAEELGSGGNGVEEAFDVLLAATTTTDVLALEMLLLEIVDGGKHTCISFFREVNGNLSTYASRCTDNKCDLFLRLSLGHSARSYDTGCLLN
jgi:hypothetical protein